MSNRLDKEREADLEPKRKAFAMNCFKHYNIEIVSEDSKRIVFMWKGERCSLFPYSGWHTGKTIQDGRGIDKLFKQLKKQ